ncbi:hypothetical protein I3842_14G131400 [Carya illinoinensis]|uniref:GATA-type domain-containing protein n=1 Tax=Carya illinoinensis TaxID=32201 RepID=A0A922AD34_CARIL|nr:hypothetical protein I3842_14G131400 [Carya illinoinensis]
MASQPFHQASAGMNSFVPSNPSSGSHGGQVDLTLRLGLPKDSHEKNNLFNLGGQYDPPAPVNPHHAYFSYNHGCSYAPYLNTFPYRVFGQIQPHMNLNCHVYCHSYEANNARTPPAPQMNAYVLLSPSSRTPGNGSSSSRRQRNINYNDPNKRCTNYNCGTNNTPMWRKGPLGPKSLCNACGIKYRKDEERKKARDIAAESSGTSSRDQE